MKFKIFENKNLIYGISDVKFGSMIGERGVNNALKFLKSIGYGVSAKNLIRAEQVFGAKVYICQAKDSGKVIKGVDGLISNIPGQILYIVSADCVPILFFDLENKVVGILHGSRKSLIGGIIKEAISKMILVFNSKPNKILVGIGPHIRKCHYFLKERTLQELKKTKFKKYFLNKKRKIYFDLTKLAIDNLLRLGIKKKNIEDCKICTFCHFKKYFSARKREENPKIYKEEKVNFASFIGLK